MFSVFKRRYGGGLHLGSSRNYEADVGMAKVRRKMYFGDCCRPYARVGELVADQLLELLTDRFGDAFVAMRVQCSG